MKHVKSSTPNHVLRHEQELRSWSQHYVADSVNAPSSYYMSHWKRGITVPHPFHREKLCTLFGKNAYLRTLLSLRDISRRSDVNVHTTLSLSIERLECEYPATSVLLSFCVSCFSSFSIL